MIVLDNGTFLDISKSMKETLTINLWQDKPLSGAHRVFVKAALKRKVTLSSVLKDLRGNNLSVGYSQIGNIQKLNCLSNPGMKVLFTVVQICNKLDVKLFISPIFGSDPVLINPKP